MLIMTASAAWAQEEKEEEKDNQLTIVAQVMSRGEIRKGGLPGATEGKDDNKASFISNRVKMTVGYERENLALKVTAQH